MKMLIERDIMKPNENNNINNIEAPFKNLPIMDVTDEAERYAGLFNNPGYVPFYAKAIIWLGFDRVHLIEKRVSDSDHADKLFTKIVKQEIESTIRRLKSQQRLKKMREENDIP